MTKDQWLLAFCDELGRLRRDVEAMSRVTMALAVQAHTETPDTDPTLAARRWHAKHPPASPRHPWASH